MIQGGKWLHAICQQFIDKPIVEIEALWIWSARPIREDARPRDRETIGSGAQRPYQLNVFLVEMVMVIGDVCVAAVRDRAGCMDKPVPNRRAAAVLGNGSLDLIG